MAATAGFPMYLHQDETSMLNLSDSEDESAPPTPREPLRSPDTSRATSRADSLDDWDEEEARRKKTQDAAANVPLHPIPAMQSAFAESLAEATANPPVPKPKLRFGDARERRARLLEADMDDELYSDLWRYRPGQTHHELFKLMAQISFGVYLLLNGIANSNVQVVNILQGHIDEVDEFLELTMEDVKLATEDIQERIDFLKLPMQNISTFEKMLEDRAFRLQIVTGNEKIEHIVNRTAAALAATVKDVEEGLKSTDEFAAYLDDQEHQPWKASRPDVIDIFEAMKGNAEGWSKAFVELQENTAILDTLLIKLGQTVADMDRRAGEVSRRTTVSPMSNAFELSLRASALMPLQFNVPFSPQQATAADASSRHSVLSPQSSRKSSQRSSSSRAHSASFSSSRTNSLRTATRSPSEDSVLSSPNVRDTMPDFQFKPLQLRRSSAPRKAPILEIETTAVMEEEKEKETPRPSPIEEEGLYILQPRTYTPQPPEPVPSPLIQRPSSPRLPDSTYVPQQLSATPRQMRTASPSQQTLQRPASPPRPTSARQARPVTPPQDWQISKQDWPNSSNQEWPTSPQHDEALPKRTSLRQRLSLKGSHPPESIQVPPRNINRPKYQSPRVQYAHQLQGPDSAYASDVDIQPPLNPLADALQEFPSPPVFINNTIPSPLSDQQFFRPVQASPHSPLQRPWTSGPIANPRPHTSATQYQHHSGYLRNQPSAMGMSTLSNVTNMDSEGGKTLKKKRSAFGWLKKAFSLDEEERAAFEAKKRQQAAGPYYEGRSPKFLDGRRIDGYGRY
ncbi:hypothetical protein E8E14_000488 [Neopestalotiopsis sp. 37M]|nr:hypothetical protein E8E14_000488 [Neopestalotiopsis sp. 37M]